MRENRRLIIPTDDELRRCVEEALADPRPSMPVREAFKQLREFHKQRVEAKRIEKEHAQRRKTDG